ncbi:MAG: glycine/sarcosine/betaine reductase component B subunit [Spirochaetaceae bacterium]|nr:glycine/sarcosine/betaine reductase component B subunit [Spirochaetaceae bacterium]
MKLELGIVPINDMKFANKTAVSGECLEINKDELIALIKEDPLVTSVELHIAKPGESTRIIPVKDVLEPRCKVEGSGVCFPGFFTGEEAPVGDGKTVVLRGAAVVTTGTVVGFQEGIIDMSGPGAEYTPFSKTVNLVVDCKIQDDVSKAVKEKSLRLMGLKTARYLGEAGKGVTPKSTETYETVGPIEQAAKYPNLPKVAYVYMLQSQGLLHDTYYYGVDVKQILPTLMYPTEVMDGAIVSGNCVSACDKNPTYIHQNSPIIHELYARHGKDFNFMGVVITNENVTLADKERSSYLTTKLVKQLGVDAVIISEEGFGNPDADLIMNCRKIEEQGIKTVLVTDEYAGQDGASQSLADANKLADAVISNGNANAVIKLPPMQKIIGDLTQANIIAGGWDGSLSADGSITAEIQVITGATSEVGFNRLSARGL